MGSLWKRRSTPARADAELRARCQGELEGAGWHVTPDPSGLGSLATRGDARALVDIAAGAINETSLRGLAERIAERGLDLHLVVSSPARSWLIGFARARGIVIVEPDALVSTLAATSDQHPSTTEGPPGPVPLATTTPPARTANPPEVTTRLIFDNQHVEIFLRDAPGDFTLVTFSPFAHEADARSYWAQPLVDQLDLRCIGIVAKGPTWYPASAMRPAIEAIRHHLAGDIVLYGSSMGGYGALKWSRALGAHTVIAFAPQATISPADIPGNSYERFFRDDLHADMRIGADDVAGRLCLFVDPWFADDMAQLALIPATERREVIAVPSLRHSTLSIAVGTKSFARLLRLCRNGSRAELDEAVRAIRRDHADTFENLAVHLAERRKPNWARWAIARSDAMHPRQGRRLRFYYQWLAALEKQGRVDEEISIVREALEHVGPDQELLFRHGSALLRRQEFEAATRAFADSIEAGGSIPAVYHGYVHAMAMTGRRTQALPAVLRGMELCPDERSLADLRDFVQAAA